MPEETVEVDSVTGEVTKTIDRQVDANGDIIITTTTFDHQGGIQMKVIEIFRRRTGADNSEQPFLVEMKTLEYGEDGKTVWKETVEEFKWDLNLIPTTKTVTEWVDDGTGRRRIIRTYHNEEQPTRHWVHNTTIEFNPDESEKKRTTHQK